jgi:excisionase family DNA binding protein
MEREYLTVRQAAELLSVHPGTVRRWIARGWLRAADSGGGRWRLAREQVERFGRQRRAASNLLAIRARTTGKVPSLAEIIAESREELERRTDHMLRRLSPHHPSA